MWPVCVCMCVSPHCYGYNVRNFERINIPNNGASCRLNLIYGKSKLCVVVFCDRSTNFTYIMGDETISLI